MQYLRVCDGPARASPGRASATAECGIVPRAAMAGQESNPLKPQDSGSTQPDRVSVEGAGSGGIRHWAMLAVSLVVTVALVWWLTRHHEGFSAARFAALLGNANPWLFLGAVGLGFAAFWVRTLRWAALVRPYAPSVSLFGLMGNTLIGFAAVLLLGRPAELVRPYLISRQIGAPFSSQVGAWLLERIYDLLVILGLAAWALATVPLENLPSGSTLALALRTGGLVVFTAAVAATALLVVFTFAAPFAVGRLREVLVLLPEHRRERISQLLDAFVGALEVSRHAGIFVRLVFYSVLHFAVVGFSNWMVFLCLPESASITLGDTFRFLGLLGLASAVPLPGLVGGYLLMAVLLLTEWLGMPLEAASVITLALWLVQLGATLPPAAASALHSGLNWRKIKNMEREAHL